MKEMDYKIKIDEFEGPFDLLLHLIKGKDINIFDINIVEVIDQYLNYITIMENLNLDIASDYLIIAAELIEIKSKMLLPTNDESEVDEEDPRESFINKLLLYKQYKEVTQTLRELEDSRKLMYSKNPSDLTTFLTDKDEVVVDELDLNVLLEAISLFIERKDEEKPLQTKITYKEYSVSKRSLEIKKLLKVNEKIEFSKLFDKKGKDYIIVTFLSILELAKKSEINIIQDKNFNEIYLTSKGSE